MFRLSASSALPVLLALAGGCAPPDPPTYPVEGTVKFEGRPAHGYVIVFSSLSEETKGWSAAGEVGPGGTFSLTTSRDGKDKPGAVAGPHKVVVVPPQIGSGPADLVLVPTRYSNYNTSGLQAEVKAGGASTFPFELVR